MPLLILASASPRRVELLRQFGIPFEVIPSSASELHDHSISASELCTTNALRKAEAIASRHPEAIVLGADTLVTLGEKHFGKPSHASEAAEMLTELSGRTHQVITGVSLLQLCPGRRELFSSETRVTFRNLDASVIKEYIRLVPVLDKAGSYAIQDRGEMIIETIEGSLSNVIGLPVESLADAFCRWDLISPPARDKIVASQRSWSPRTEPDRS